MNTFEFANVKNTLVKIANEIEQAAMLGTTKEDWNSCIALRDELVIANDSYIRARYELGYEFTNQYRDEVAEALDGVAVAMFEFSQRLEDAA